MRKARKSAIFRVVTVRLYHLAFICSRRLFGCLGVQCNTRKGQLQVEAAELEVWVLTLLYTCCRQALRLSSHHT